MLPQEQLWGGCFAVSSNRDSGLTQQFMGVHLLEAFALSRQRSLGVFMA